MDDTVAVECRSEDADELVDDMTVTAEVDDDIESGELIMTGMRGSGTRMESEEVGWNRMERNEIH